MVGEVVDAGVEGEFLEEELLLLEVDGEGEGCVDWLQVGGEGGKGEGGGEGGGGWDNKLLTIPQHTQILHPEHEPPTFILLILIGLIKIVT